jgi:probable HAF family extracellular repeat protein
VGTSGPLGRSGHAFVWQNGAMRPLATRYGLGSVAHWISNTGRVAGNAETFDRRTEAAVWTIASSANPEKVAPWMVPNQDDACAVNDRDEVVCSARYRAYLWSAGRMIDLGTLGGEAATATGLNNLGEVVGISVTADGRSHVFEWSGGVLKDLNARPPGTLHVPVINALNAINDYGQAVGIVTVKREMHAMLYDNGNIEDLNEYIAPYKNLTLEIARGINDRGQIVGEAHVGNRPVSFVLTPIAGLRPVVTPLPVKPAPHAAGHAGASAAPAKSGSAVTGPAKPAKRPAVKPQATDNGKQNEE